MNTPQDFVSWLEGFLDACKNSPTTQQIKEVRKKISMLSLNPNTLSKPTGEIYKSLWSQNVEPKSSEFFPTISLVPPSSNIPNNGPLDEEFIKAVEKSKTASTMEELNS